MKLAGIVAIALFAAAAACRHEAEEPAASSSATAPADSSGPSLHAAGAPAARLAAASSIPLVRGVVVLTSEAARVTPCGASAPVDLKDETQGALAEAYGQLANEQTGEMWAELRGEQTSEGVTAREVVRAMPTGSADPCASLPMPGTLVAQGSEPFWSITVGESSIELRRPDLPEPLTFPKPEPETKGTSRTWTTTLAEPSAHQLQLVVGPARCKDGMSGAWYGLAAEAVVDGKALSGCAVSGD